MCPGLDLLTDELERLSHGVSVAPGHDPPVALGPGRAEGAEETGPFGPLIVRRAGPRPLPRPASRAFVLLTHPGFVLNPELYWRAAPLAADVVDDVADVFWGIIYQSPNLSVDYHANIDTVESPIGD